MVQYMGLFDYVAALKNYTDELESLRVLVRDSKFRYGQIINHGQGTETEAKTLEFAIQGMYERISDIRAKLVYFVTDRYIDYTK